MFVALVTQREIHKRHIVICSLPVSTKFFRIISWTERFSENKGILNTKCVLIFSTNLLKKFSLQEEVSEI